MHSFRTRRRRAFTLIELLVVLVILGLLAALIGPKFIKNIGKGQRGTAKAQIKNFDTALKLYSVDAGGPPSTQQGLDALVGEPSGSPRPLKWDGPYIDKIPLDPWGNPYVYEQQDDDTYVIISYGKDGKEGGTGEDADIVSTDLGAE